MNVRCSTHTFYYTVVVTLNIVIPANSCKPRKKCKHNIISLIAELLIELNRTSFIFCFLHRRRSNSGQGNFINVLLQIVIDGSINWTRHECSVSTDAVLQVNVATGHRASFNTVWVSSDADQTRSMQDQMSGAVVVVPQVPNIEYQNALADIEAELLAFSS
ncbi:uncharacterized protein LOC129761410 [Toxorhynchites rutilus septentrionalis]|uniref:uncharacterized protein LOC129761410 n=1 Tax=Toxorhynchites rutilus septentrionalis TaxID=329112 RepID=UPI002479DE61|nr:uncharacterized protein LOC129761410 [Toxorhynchites rutilus septentrionalis]